MDDRDERIRQRAYQLWREEGCPAGREQAHWEMATELVAIEDNQRGTLKPVQQENPVEPLEAVENQGEFPTLADQGEESTYPSRDLLKRISEGEAPATAPVDQASSDKSRTRRGNVARKSGT